MTEDMVELKVAVGILASKVESMQNTINNQASKLEELLELYNKGKGAAWLLVGLGGLTGALMSKLVTLIPLLAK